MNLSEIVASRIYTWQYEGEVKLLVGGKARTNPLADSIVTKKVNYAGQAATGEMLLKATLKVNPNYAPSEEYTPRHEATEHPCIVRAINNGQLQVRILRPKARQKSYFVNGLPATTEQLELIQKYLPTRKANPLVVKVMFPYVENLGNVANDIDLESLEETEE